VIATLSRSGDSPIDAPIAGSAVAMIVESSDCMNIAHDTIRLMASWCARGVIAVLYDGYGPESANARDAHEIG